MLNFRFVQKSDVDILYAWANDPIARQNSYNKAPIKYEDHVKWFNQRIVSSNFYCYIFSYGEEIIGQVRIEKKGDANEAVISISIDKTQRGKGYSVEMLQKASGEFLTNNNEYIIIAYIFKANIASYKSFVKAGYELKDELIVNEVPSYMLVYKKY